MQPATQKYKGTATIPSKNFFFAYEPIETYNELSAKAIFVGFIQQVHPNEDIKAMDIRITVVPNLNTREY